MTRDPFTAGFVEVTLPDAGRVRGNRPTLADLARQDLLPDSLRLVALHYADPSWFLDTNEDADTLAQRAAQRVAATRLLVARFITHTWDDDAQAWVAYDRPMAERMALLPGPDSPGGMSALDYDLLEDVVLGIRSGDEASAVTARILAGEPPQEAVDADTLDATFRGLTGLPTPGADSPRVARPVTRDHLPPRRRRRARVPAGRGPGHGAGSGR